MSLLKCGGIRQWMSLLKCRGRYLLPRKLRIAEVALKTLVMWEQFLEKCTFLETEQ
jgi:hypothetical protein